MRIDSRAWNREQQGADTRGYGFARSAVVLSLCVLLVACGDDVPPRPVDAGMGEASPQDSAITTDAMPDAMVEPDAAVLSVSIISPTDGALLTEADDCDPMTAGLQVRVEATTDADDGATAMLSVGDAVVSAEVRAGMAEGCVAALDGRGVMVAVSVAGIASGVGMAAITVDVDATAPTASLNLSDPITISSPRDGEALFEWTSVDDGGFELVSYELRCSNRIISDEMRWADATPYPLTSVPGVSGAAESEMLSGFRLGTTMQCSLRGRDLAGNLTPLGTSASLNNQPRSAESAAMALGAEAPQVFGVGDVNGDTRDDVLVVGDVGSSVAYLYFGTTAGVGMTPDVTFVLPVSAGVGHRGAALGDFSGDTIPDFVIAAPSTAGDGGTFSGRAWVLHGRAAGVAWPGMIDLTTGCAASLCLSGNTPAGLMGFAAGGLDYNGDGTMDLALGAPGVGTTGRVYVLLGGGMSPEGATQQVPSATLSGFDIVGPAVAQFGQSLTSPGDVDGARDEVVIGAAGVVYMSQGRSYDAMSGLQTVDSTTLTTLASGSTTFGETVRAIGDYNGDGLVDIAVRDATNEGSVSIFAQAAGGIFATSAVVLENDMGRPSGNFYGASIGLGFHPALGSRGDIDGDGLADILVGSDERNLVGADPRAAGACEVVYGDSAVDFDPGRLMDTGVVFQPTGVASNRRVAAYVGDLNGDGFSDIFCVDSTAGLAYAVY